MNSESPYYSSVPTDMVEDPYEEIGSVSLPSRGVAIEGYVDYQFELGRKGKAPGQFGGWVQHFTVSHDERILYVCDVWNKRIQLIDIEKRKPIHAFPSNMPGFNFQARGIGVLRNGNLCVNCVGFSGTSRIGIFTPEGRIVGSFGAGVIGSSTAMTVDDMDRISVIDRRKMRIATCSKEGRLLASFDPGIEDDLLRICSNSRGQLIVPNHLHNSIMVYDPSGVPLHKIKPLCGAGYEFRYPCGVTCDYEDNILVSDVGNSRVLTFTPDGQYRSALLTKRDHKIWRPHDIVATPRGKLLLSEVSQTFIKVFSFSSGRY